MDDTTDLPMVLARVVEKLIVTLPPNEFSQRLPASLVVVQMASQLASLALATTELRSG